jgi:hypothetical protein
MNRRQEVKRSIPRDKSARDLESRIRGMARAAGFTGVPEAYARLDRGELDGTRIEVHLKMLRFLRGANGHHGAKSRATK